MNATGKTDPYSSSSAVLSGWVLAIIRALQSRGHSLESIARQSGIDTELLRNSGNRYSQADVSRLWNLARSLVDHPGFGLEVAKQLRPASFHVVGHTMSCSVTLYRALQRFARYCRLISDAATANLVLHGDEVVLEFHFDMGKKPPIYQSFDTVLSGVVYFLRWISCEPLIPLVVNLRHSESKLDQSFYDFFGCPIRYGAPLDSIGFAKADLEKPLLTSNEELAAILDEVANHELEIRMEGRFTVRVRDALITQFSQKGPSKEQTATMLHMTERTLLRRLKDEGVTYQSVLNQLREELALQYIRQGELSLSEVADKLGFSDYGSFSRAFVRWTGSRPTSLVKDYGQFNEIEAGPSNN